MSEPRAGGPFTSQMSFDISQIVLLPGLLYPFALFSDDATFIASLFGLWALGVAFATPFNIWRAADVYRRGDAQLATAFAGVGLAPWLVFVVLIQPITTPLGLKIALPFFYVWGSAGLYATRGPWPRPRTAALRRAVLIAGGVTYALFAALSLLALALGVSDLGMLAVGACIVVATINAVAAGVVLVAASRRSYVERDLKPNP